MVSVLAITYKAFNVTIDKIPVAGLSITFDNRVFVFLILVSLVYFFITFALYYYIDIRNVERTGHQIESERRRNDKLRNFSVLCASQPLERFKEKNVGHILTRKSQGYGLENLLAWIERQPIRGKKFWGIAANRHIAPCVLYKISILPPGYDEESGKLLQLESISASKYKELYRDLAIEIRNTARHHKMRYLALRVRLEFQKIATATVYFVRNYGTDGALPIFLALLAIGALYELVPVDWLRHITPPR